MDNLDVLKLQKENFLEFYRNNKMRIIVAGAVVAAGVFGGFYWATYYIPAQESKAAKALAPMHYYFKNDSMELVLNGDKSRRIVSAKSIADDYGSTSKGKEAALMVSIAYMRTKKYEEALNYIDKTEANDDILSAAILNMKAVCYSNLGETEKAASQFAKAGDVAENEFAAEYYKRAGIHYETAENYEKALNYYQLIADKYPTTGVGSDINKYVYKMKAKLGEYNP
jgi:tetratricopeptide (TPR) repeat protein